MAPWQRGDFPLALAAPFFVLINLVEGKIMDIMIILQIVVLLGAIYIGVRLGGIGIGYAGGAGVLVLGLCLGMKPGNIPWDVIMIIGSVIAAISAMRSPVVFSILFISRKRFSTRIRSTSTIWRRS